MKPFCKLCGQDISLEEMVEQANIDKRVKIIMELPLVKVWLAQQDTRSTKAKKSVQKNATNPNFKEQ